ncbi:esterase [Planctomycetota bacterium]
MLKLRRLLLVFFIASVCLAMVVNAQDAPAGRGGAGVAAGRGAAAGRGMRGMFGGRGGITSPEIADDNMVTFRISAPEANSVSLSGDWSSERGAWGAGGPGVAMTKDPNGLWSVTVGPLESEMYGYTFNVDSALVWDPSNNDLKRDGTNVVSVVIVPGGDGDLYSVKDVPHGTLAKVWYESPTLDLRRRMYVYTPPGYYDSDEKYPVLYLLHGMGGDEDAWTSLGRTHMILDNLIAQGEAKPMLVVMTNGNANQTASPDARPAGQQDAGFGMMGRGAARGEAGARGAAPAGERGAAGAARGEAGARGAAPAGERGAAGAARGEAGARGAGAARGGIGGGLFPESIVTDIIPFMEKNFRVIANQENRAVAGLSMGGMHTRTVTLAHPDTFSYYGVMSGGTYTVDELADHKDTLKLVFLSCGERENPDGVNNAASALEEAGFNAVSYVSPDSAHEWLTWRRSLIELAPLLFKD